MNTALIALCPECGIMEEFYEVCMCRRRLYFNEKWLKYGYTEDEECFDCEPYPLCPEGHWMAEFEVSKEWARKLLEMNPKDRVKTVIDLVKRGEAKIFRMSLETFEKYAKDSP